MSISFGGDLVRHDTTATYAGPGGSAELFGLYFADAGQHIEHRLFVDHNEPQHPQQRALQGRAAGPGRAQLWIGNVLIRPEAEGIDTYELNRNLLLTDGARADSVPNLEIETGEIEGAGHASATGRFDDEQLFYLRARGIPEEEARRLVLRGFFAEMIHRIGVPVVGERMLAAIEAELEIAMQARRGAGMSARSSPRATTRAGRDDAAGARRAWTARSSRSRSCAPRTATSTPSATSARTARCRCPRARSTAAPSSAGCTARASTCAPACRPGCPPSRPCRSTP